MRIDTSLETVVDYDAELAVKDGNETWFVRTDDLDFVFG